MEKECQCKIIIKEDGTTSIIKTCEICYKKEIDKLNLVKEILILTKEIFKM